LRFGPLPKTTDDLSRFPLAIATPLSARANGTAAASAVCAHERFTSNADNLEARRQQFAADTLFFK
jgi:hypothetical protein